MKKIIAIFLSVLTLMAMFTACSKRSDHSEGNTSPSVTNINSVQAEENVHEVGQEHIQTILSKEYVHCLDFANGYAFVYDNLDIYIIDEKGYICSKITKGMPHYDLIYTGEKSPFYDGVCIIWDSNYGSLEAISLSANGDVINHWEGKNPSGEGTYVEGIAEKNILCVTECAMTVDGKVYKIGSQNYKGEWMVGPYQTNEKIVGYWTNNNSSPYIWGENYFCCGNNYYHMTTGEKYESSEMLELKDNNFRYGRRIRDRELERGYFNNKNQLVIDLKDELEQAGADFENGIGTYVIANRDSAYFIKFIDETGKEIIEPKRISFLQTRYFKGYSEGYLGVWVYNEETYDIERIEYIDTKGNVAFSIPGPESYTYVTDCSSKEIIIDARVHSGIVTNGKHYYNTKGEMLF